MRWLAHAKTCDNDLKIFFCTFSYGVGVWGTCYQFLLFKACWRLESFNERRFPHSSASKEQNPGKGVTKILCKLSTHLWERMKSCSGGFSHMLSRLSCRLGHLLVESFTSFYIDMLLTLGQQGNMFYNFKSLIPM